MDTDDGLSFPIGMESGSENEDEVIDIDPPKVLGDILESLAGAIFLDSGMDLEKVWGVFQPLFDKKISKSGSDMHHLFACHCSHALTDVNFTYSYT